MVNPVLLVSLLAGTVSAQWRGRPTTTQRPPASSTAVGPPSGTQALYGQCGGQQWAGPTNCPNGAYCRQEATNVWYAQCVAIAGATPVNSGGGAVETRVLTTIFSVGGPSPTLVSTFITYVTPRSSRPATTATVVTVTLTPDEPCEDEYYC
ncbi:hypothetical protein B0H67DRAFT_682922 [Lasiosphaeris hirsuta]|uniref:CBM1 domain-containing protein n=1 Tax=Lasiosphaeris hirsuta TaxID=260670 RepID=A0AA40ASG4_9PEZI|nr:hypothetical protein B0H67DRAFT_682922 [Lasiosphaeris hirsuta]